ncbi:ABC transporter permease subunit [Plantactinospora sp. KBS50]|uniref:ABC transporter permease subunit n=1 Tax=Plantactinospora sp. KBS50 TaxID=2024580 RepID=UPI000BAAFC64|nr:ABC transporter permease subunit [Plantactinospora sp. KBS50]ASW56203.1 transmembrane transport protein [Plantactinospora sp. KBS50]
MMWLSWRQFRVPALVGLAALTGFAVYLVVLGIDIHDSYDAYRARCQSLGDCEALMSQFRSEYENTLLFIAAGFGLIPAVVGAFWGAPLVAREIETGTHRLVWNQSVTRRRWLAVKVLVVGTASAAVASVASALLTWAAGPVDLVADHRFSTIMFGARNIAPVAYTVFGFALVTIVGLLLRRTVPAIALTMLAVIVVQFAMPNLVRPHYLPPERLSLDMTTEAINQARGLGSLTGGAVVKGLNVPDAWVTDVSELQTADGQPLPEAVFDDCFYDAPPTGATGTFGDLAVCLGNLDLHVDITYQPHHRYWPFQLIETALYLALSALLIGFGLRRIHRSPS